jgi:hypothetical protein
MEKLTQRLPDTASGGVLTLFPLNLGADEPSPVDALRLEEIMRAAQNFEKTLLVTAINRKRPRMFDLESRS